MEQEEEDVMDETKDKGPVISEKLEEQVKYLQDRVQHLERVSEGIEGYSHLFFIILLSWVRLWCI